MCVSVVFAIFFGFSREFKSFTKSLHYNWGKHEFGRKLSNNVAQERAKWDQPLYIEMQYVERVVVFVYFVQKLKK